MGQEPGSDLRHIDLAGRGAEHEVLSLVDRVGQLPAVEQAEDSGCRPREALVSIQEGMVPGQGVQQRCGLVLECQVGVATEEGDLRAARGRRQEADDTATVPEVLAPKGAQWRGPTGGDACPVRATRSGRSRSDRA